MGLERDDIRRALARAYCQWPNRKKPIDTDLVESMADEIMVVIDNLIVRHMDGLSDKSDPAAAALPDRRH